MRLLVVAVLRRSGELVHGVDPSACQYCGFYQAHDENIRRKAISGKIGCASLSNSLCFNEECKEIGLLMFASIV